MENQLLQGLRTLCDNEKNAPQRLKPQSFYAVTARLSVADALRVKSRALTKLVDCHTNSKSLCFPALFVEAEAPIPNGTFTR